jgi:hypothetical protein
MSQFGSHFDDISNLSNLLNDSRQASETPSEKFNQPASSTAQSNVVVSSKGSRLDQTLQKASTPAVDPKDIWQPDEILYEDALIDWKDDRPTPRYEFSYKQVVGTEDTLLGMTEKTPLTADCSHLVVKIHFPLSSMKDLDLDVTRHRIKASSKTHHLFTYFPVTVEAEQGNAKFDKQKEVLTITLPIKSEF